MPTECAARCVAYETAQHGVAALLPDLFGPETQCEELFGDAQSDPLLIEERAGTERFVPSRLREFQRGRHCARRALARLGQVRAPVLRAPDRSPVWPAGFTGSISHTGRGSLRWCGAVVARARDVGTVGMDAELDEPLAPELYKFILTPSEVARAMDLAPSERGWVTKLIFSAKECVYKCQYPLTRRLLGFQAFDVVVNVDAGTFAARCLLDLSAGLSAGSVIPGRFVRRRGLLLTGALLAGAAASTQAPRAMLDT